MYIIFLFFTCLFLKISHCVDFYAGLTFDSSELPSDFPSMGLFNNKLYFYYSNTVVDNGDHKFDDNYKPLDSIASGLSVYSDSIYELEKIPDFMKNKHLLGTLESWCYVLTLFVFYPKFNNGVKYKDTSLFPHLFNRCMNLNYNFTNYKVDLDFKDLLINTDTKIDDVYLFEKFSRMSPRPCYFEKDNEEVCKKSSELKDLDLVNDFVSHPKCYLNNFFHRKCVPYSELKKKTLNSFKSLLDPDVNLYMYSNKWTYLYMPKRVELELAMDKLSYLLFWKLVGNCESKKCKEIQNLQSSVTLKNLSVKFVVGQLDFTSKDPNKKVSVSFLVTFKVDQFRANNVAHVFDFIIKDLEFDRYYDTLLGPNPSNLLQKYQSGNEDAEKEDEKPKTFKEKYNKYVQDFLNKKKVKLEYERKKKLEVPELFKNKFEFLNMSGLGQHRNVTLSMTLNPFLFKRFTPVNSKYYLKLTHMLDTSVYIDIDELSSFFNYVKDESKVFNLPPDPVVEENGVATVKVKTLVTHFVDIEQPEMHSSPVVYHGYVVLDESILKYKSVVVTYTLKFHTRYMHMYKRITDELSAVDNLRLLRNPVSKDYAMTLVSHPFLHMLNPVLKFDNLPLNYSYLRFLRFLGDISFSKFSSTDEPIRGLSEDYLKGNKWVPVLFNDCNNSNLSLKLCQGYRTGLAMSTKVINTYFCNPIIREIGGDVVESQCYMVFSVPIGNQNDYKFIRNVTVSTVLVSCLVSAIMVVKYFNEKIPKPTRKKKSKKDK